MTAAAIHWLAPWLLGMTVCTYAAHVDRAAVRRGIDPLLVVALVHRESRWDRHAYSRGNWGLAQLRVSRTTRPHLLHRPWVLFDARRNIQLAVKALAGWRAYHRRTCIDPAHEWFAHFQHGTRVRSLGSGRRVRQLYRALVRRFRR